MGISGCNWLCPAAMRQSLVALFSLSASIKDRSLLWIVVRSQIYYHEHILAMGSGRLVTLLSWVSALSGPIDWMRRKVEV
jgi:hypothetical protein